MFVVRIETEHFQMSDDDQGIGFRPLYNIHYVHISSLQENRSIRYNSNIVEYSCSLGVEIVAKWHYLQDIYISDDFILSKQLNN
jgi:hypothetical protein